MEADEEPATVGDEAAVEQAETEYAAEVAPTLESLALETEVRVWISHGGGCLHPHAFRVIACTSHPSPPPLLCLTRS